MPYSTTEGKEWTAALLAELAPRRVLDIGAGAGTYRKLAGDTLPGCEWVGVEVWEPYIERFRLRDLYDAVHQVDARDLDWAAVGQVDVVIAGDVLEHMTTDEAVELVARARAHARWVIVSIPIIDYPQGANHGNPYEVHVREDWTDSEVRDTWPVDRYVAGDIVGVYLIPGVTDDA